MLQKHPKQLTTVNYLGKVYFVVFTTLFVDGRNTWLGIESEFFCPKNLDFCLSIHFLYGIEIFVNGAILTTDIDCA